MAYRVEPAEDIQSMMVTLLAELEELSFVDPGKIDCFRAFGSKSKAMARVWSLPKIWRRALGESPRYVIEVISQNYDNLSLDNKKRVLIHELLHIPQKFSGGLVPHKCFGKHRVGSVQVERLFKKLSKL